MFKSKFIQVTLVTGLVLLLGLGSSLYLTTRAPLSEKKRYLSFSIEAGESFKSASQRLKAERLIRKEALFYYLGRLTGKSGRIKAGEYELNNQMSAWEILNVITGSHVKLYRVTLKEGMTMFQVAQLLDDLGLMDQIKFLET